jgi:hypothetical protein
LLDTTQGLRFAGGSAPTGADDLGQRLEQLNAIGASLSAERDIHRLLETILTAAKTITRADGGTLYRVSDDKTLRFEIVRTTLAQVLPRAHHRQPGAVLPDPALQGRQAEQHGMVAAYSALTGKTVNIADATPRKASTSPARAPSTEDRLPLEVVPHRADAQPRARDHRRAAAHQRQDPRDRRDRAVLGLRPAPGRVARLAGRDRAHQPDVDHQLEQLFESFINLINSAIDEKSPYTGGHCQRVPQLTMLLAEAVNETKRGPLSDFHMTDKDRYELKIAGLLHDCGKVTTPVHVVDKATKLETIFDRIHLDRHALRGAQARRRDRVAQRRLDRAGARAAQRLRELEERRKFLHACNIGGERMRDEDMERRAAHRGYAGATSRGTRRASSRRTR